MNKKDIYFYQDKEIKKCEILLIQGGIGSERDISIQTGTSVARALKKLDLSFEILDAGEDLPYVLSQKKPFDNKIAFIALHGKYGEDGLVQSLCEYLKLPYTGNGVLTSALCMDKIFLKSILRNHGFPVPQGYVLDLKREEIPEKAKMNFPFVVKPSREGSSFGISIVQKEDEWKDALYLARQYDTSILVEEYISGIEYTLPFFMNRILSSVEIKPKRGFYDFKNKYLADRTQYFIPARVSKKLDDRAREIALQVSQLLSLKSYARIDFRLDLVQKIPYVIEVNTLPGFTSTSLIPKSAAYEGLTFEKVIWEILKMADLDYRYKLRLKS